MQFNPYLNREWELYMAGPDMEVCGQLEYHPAETGVYFMFAQDGRLTYIGMSVDIGYRLVQHHWAGRRCDCYGAIYVPADIMLDVETAYIHALRPPLNRKLDRPRFTAHEKMVARINELWANSDKPLEQQEL